MLRLGQELGIGVVATNDAHYLRREDAESHDVLLAIGTGSDLDDPKRFRFTGEESYFKSEKEMRALFPDHPEVLANTQAVADLCEFDFEKKYFLPGFPRPAELRDRRSAARGPRRARARRGATARRCPRRSRSGWTTSSASSTRPATPATSSSSRTSSPRRASAASRWARAAARRPARIVAYALGITDVCPLKFDLLFERFLNPERVSMPDIDVDFCFERRGEVIEYVREKYGRGASARSSRSGR